MWSEQREVGVDGARVWRLLAVTSALLVTAAFAACGSDPSSDAGDGNPPPAAAEHDVNVDLQEWAVLPDLHEAGSGDVTFHVQNVGEETHEFVVVATDLGFRELPTVGNGSIDEEGDGMEAVDEIEDITPGSQEELTVNLSAGNYVMFCNVVQKDNGEVESHYANGMSVAFSVK
jgi:uncharacterized cupredoxin-like copper-binding protein